MIRLLVILILLGLASPFLVQAGYGFYQGYDVPSGMKTLVTGFFGDSRRFRQDFSEPEPLEIQPATVTWAGDLENEVLSEASGLAVSHHNTGVFFSINDSGNEPRLFAFDEQGGDLGSWPITYPGFHDFEDLSAFELDGERYLVVADTGDNFYWRPTLTLLVIREPDMVVTPPETQITPEWSVFFSFPQGYRDIEGVAADEQNGEFLLVTKRQVPAELFAVPMKPEGTVIATHAGDLLIPQPTERDLREDPDWGYGRSMPTAFDISGRSAVIQTYKDAYVYQRRLGENWQEAFTRLPKRVALPQVHGLESVALSDDTVIVTGERHKGTQRSGLFFARLK